MADPETYRALAESAWAWVLDQVRRDRDGPWIPENTSQTEPGEFRHGMYSGVDGLAHVLAEIRLTRELTGPEASLREEIAKMVVDRIPAETEFDAFSGLVSTIGVLTALETPGADLAVDRLLTLATPDGWSTSFLGPPRAVVNARCNDATLGNASVLLGALFALRYDVPGAAELATSATEVLLADRVATPTGLDWPFIPARFVLEPRRQMPNWSHGLAGVAGSLVAAGVSLGRADLVDAGSAPST